MRAMLLLVFAAAAQGSPSADLTRARSKVPTPQFRGADAAATAEVLNGHLTRLADGRLRPCSSWSLEALRSSTEAIFRGADRRLLDVYDSTADPRRRSVSGLAELRQRWADVEALLQQETLTERTRLRSILRDGLCHETVAAFVHHLSELGRQELLADEAFRLPFLPKAVHEDFLTDAGLGETQQQVIKVYKSQVSCQQCHVGPINGFDADATLPLPPQGPEQQLARQRMCDYQYQPKCGPCEGLGGPRTGDDLHEFTPLKCEVVQMPEEVPASQRVRPGYPKAARAHITGESRWPLAVDPKTPGKYSPMDMDVFLGWDDTMGRYKYDFGGAMSGASAVYLQSIDQIRKNSSSGVTISVFNGKCACQDSIAGLMHADSFVDHEDLDPLDLPANEGGATYLGRIRIPELDGGAMANGSVVADHYMKWAFHFLVDASDGPNRGFPVRLYGPYGVRQVFYDWSLEPDLPKSDMWKLPAGCEVQSPVCTELLGAAFSHESPSHGLIVTSGLAVFVVALLSVLTATFQTFRKQKHYQDTMAMSMQPVQC